MNEEEFYASQERLMSPEWDFGVWWRDPNGRTHRITLIEDTGEVYAVRLADMQFQVIGHGDHDAVAERLHGWAEMCEQPGSLAWAISRLKETNGDGG